MHFEKKPIFFSQIKTNSDFSLLYFVFLFDEASCSITNNKSFHTCFCFLYTNLGTLSTWKVITDFTCLTFQPVFFIAKFGLLKAAYQTFQDRIITLSLSLSLSPPIVKILDLAYSLMSTILNQPMVISLLVIRFFFPKYSSPFFSSLSFLTILYWFLEALVKSQVNNVYVT